MASKLLALDFRSYLWQARKIVNNIIFLINWFPAFFQVVSVVHDLGLTFSSWPPAKYLRPASPLNLSLNALLTVRPRELSAEKCLTTVCLLQMIPPRHSWESKKSEYCTNWPERAKTTRALWKYPTDVTRLKCTRWTLDKQYVWTK